MAETSNIAEISEEISTRIFQLFGWKLAGIYDANFDCCNTTHRKKTHPYDCVFYYDDPRVKKRIYLLTDLKSYAKKSIKPSSLQSPMRNLAKSIECAKISSEWKDEVLHDDCGPYEIHGLLFVYNHDKEFHSDFHTYSRKLTSVRLDLPSKSKMFLFDPEKIRFIEMVRLDMERTLGHKKIRDIDQFEFFYPNKILKPIPETTIGRLPIELLMSPHLIVSYDTVRFSDQKEIKGYLIYHRGVFDSVDECHFLLHYILRQRLLSSDHQIEIRVTNGCAKLETYFEQAKSKIVGDYGNVPEFQSRIEEIKIVRVARTTESFSEKKVGLDRKKRNSK